MHISHVLMQLFINCPSIHLIASMMSINHHEDPSRMDLPQMHILHKAPNWNDICDYFVILLWG